MASTSRSSPPSSPAPALQQKASSSQKHHVAEDDPCTDRCRSKEHGRRIWMIAQGSEDDSEVVALWSKTCLNYSQVRDDFGRTALHAAATNGLLKAAEWLVKIQQCNINAKDYISGYTPLHRSIYCGHLQVARSLIKLGADVNVRDNEGLTPFELCQMDRPIPFKQNAGDMTELTVWGSNANYNLGLGHQQPRLVPDVLEKFRKEDLSLVQVAMGTYQTMFLTKTGKVYACGYGMGGRLGTGNETTVLTPSLVHLKSACKIIAVGQDHTIFLTDNKVWTVGSNDFGQLGQPKECHKLLTPRTVNSLSKFQISGVLASSIHSVFYDQSVVIMCGANQGQFGKQTVGGNKQNVYSPTIVSDRLQLESSQQMQQGLITTVSGNEQCTAICVENRYLYLLRRYQHARIDSRNTTSQKITKIEVSGEKDSITLFILTSSGRVLIWRENYNPSTKEHKGAFTRLVFSSNRLLDVKDFSVNQSSIVVITNTGEAYKAGWNYNNPPVIVGTMEERYGQVAATDFQVAVRRRGLRNTEAPAMALEQMKIKRIPNVHTGLLVSSDVKGHNFSILQRHQIMDVTDIPYVGGSLMKDDILELYNTMVEGDGIHDLTFEVDSFHRFPVHAFILCSASPVFQKIIGDHLPTSAEEPVVIKVTNALFGIDPQKHLSLQDGKIFKAVLDMIYTSSCFVTSDEYILELRNCFLMDDEKKGTTFGEKLKDIMKMRQLCRALELEHAVEQLQEVLVQIDSNAFPQDVPKIRQPLSRHRFNREEGDMMCDVYLESSDKVLIQAHKCILVARVEYFRSMFSVNWSYGLPTASKSKPMSLPFSAKALLSVLDYVYTDKTVVNDGEFDLTWEAIACSDYMMLDRLLQIYECEMTKNINLKNVADILAFAWKHNSDQLRNTCFDFISLNLTAMLENKMLENLPNEIVVGLGSYYREVQARNLNYARTLHKRDEANIPNATDYSCALEMTPAEVLEQLQVIEETDAALLQKKSVSKPTKSRVRLRSRTLSESESLQDNDESNKELLLQIDCSIPENKLSTPLGSPAQAAFTPERKYIVPMPRNSMPVESPKPAKSPIKIDEFPSLGAAASSSPPTRGFTQPRRTSFEGSTQPTLAQSMAVNMQPVVAQGSSMASTSPRGSSNTPPQPIKQSPATASSSGAKKKIKWRAIKSDKDILSKSPVAAVSGPSSPPALTSDGRDRNNPWKVKTTKQVTFKDIVDDEVEKRRNFEKAVSKPLKLMQIEDEAINVLTDMYTSEDTDDFIELLTVERVVASNVSAPTWVQHAGALATMMSPDTPI